MIGAISGVGASYWQPWYQPASPMQNRAVQNAALPQGGMTRTAAIPAPQTGIPVQAVSPVPAADATELDVEGLIRWMDNDPAAMSVRGRIQYPGREEDAKASGIPVEEAQDALPDQKAESAREVAESAECQTCKRRKYQDGSDDPGVSFKSPTHISPEAAATAVRGHENEHVVREQAKAEREDRHVVSQTVTYKTAICPECGRVYVAGGVTRTVTAANTEEEKADDSGFSAAA